MQLRDRLEFSNEENAEYDLFEKLFPDFLEITLGNSDTQINVLYPPSKIETFRVNSNILDKTIYTLKSENIVDENAIEFVFERTHALERANKIGSLIIKWYDKLNFFYRHSILAR